MIKKVCAVLGWVVGLTLLWALPVAAQRHGMTPQAPAAPLDVAPAQIGFALNSGSTAWLDNDNPCASPPEGPRAMWMAIAVTNTATVTLTSVVAELSGFSSAHYALTADPVRYVGNLAPGETYHGYWYVDYSSACQAGVSDGYTLTVTAVNLSAPASYTGSLTTASSEGVGGGAADIIPASLDSEVAIGQVFTQAVSYEFPRNISGVLFQPTGDAGFADTCFRLVQVEVIASNMTEVLTGTLHRLYFDEAEPGNTRLYVTMAYVWQVQCQAETNSRPWATSTRGDTPKYANKFNALNAPFPAAELSLDVTVSVEPTLLTSAGTVTYTVRLRNSFTQPIVVHRVHFKLPQAVVYKGVATASAIDPNNSSQYPALDATGVLTWTGVPLLSYTVPASGTVGSGEPGTLELIFTADAPAISGRYTATVTATVGTLDVGLLTTTFDVDLPTAVTLAAFEATPREGAILITWKTAMELDHVGFNLYRSTAAAGPHTQLNATLIPPQFPGEVMGGSYEWLDTNVKPGVLYYYKLEDIDIHGVETFHGSVQAKLTDAATTTQHVVYIPLVFRNP
ncbi:MAG: hypothetical protein JXR84_10725 [Anaerolineae bacterium]|nr:hypothetical protein [Anaerolineae bacterium]